MIAVHTASSWSVTMAAARAARVLSKVTLSKAHPTPRARAREDTISLYGARPGAPVPRSKGLRVYLRKEFARAVAGAPSRRAQKAVAASHRLESAAAIRP